jgi:hypothetical protein
MRLLSWIRGLFRRRMTMEDVLLNMYARDAMLWHDVIMSKVRTMEDAEGKGTTHD